MFDEDPVKWYKTEAECLEVAEVKAGKMTETFSTFGYYVESEAHSCMYVVQKNEA